MTDPTIPEPRIDLQEPPALRPFDFLAEAEQLVRPTDELVCIRCDGLPAAFVRWVGPGYVFQLEEEFWVTEYDVEIVIPPGFEFDAASVPRLAWSLISPTELGVISPLVHDWLYRTGGQHGELSRAQADRIFRRHMKAEGVSGWRRWFAYTAVRVGGRGSWRGG